MPDMPERPPIATEPLSLLLVLPDDLSQLEKGLNAWVAVLDGLKREHEILLLDVSPAHRTVEVPERHGKARVIRPERGNGIGAALRTGVTSARHPLLCTSTADKQYRAADLQLLLNEIDRVDVVSGYRASVPVPAVLRGIGMGFRLLARLLFSVPLEPLAGWLGWKGHLYGVFVRSWTGVRIRDVQSEFKLFRREILARIPIQSDGPAVHTEVLAKMNFLNAFMYEVPITYRAENGPEIEWKEIMSELRRVLANPEFGAPLPSPAS